MVHVLLCKLFFHQSPLKFYILWPKQINSLLDVVILTDLILIQQTENEILRGGCRRVIDQVHAYDRITKVRVFIHPSQRGLSIPERFSFTPVREDWVNQRGFKILV